MNTKLLSTDRPIALYYILVTEVSAYSEVGASQCSVSGNWNLIHTTIGSIEFEEVPLNSNAGTYYENSLVATVPGHDINSPEKTDKLNGRKVLLRIDYKSGLKKIIGNKEFSPTLLISENSGVNTFRKLKSEFNSIYINRWLSE